MTALPTTGVAAVLCSAGRGDERRRPPPADSVPDNTGHGRGGDLVQTARGRPPPAAAADVSSAPPGEAIPGSLAQPQGPFLAPWLGRRGHSWLLISLPTIEMSAAPVCLYCHNPNGNVPDSGTLCCTVSPLFHNRPPRHADCRGYLPNHLPVHRYTAALADTKTRHRPAGPDFL